LRRKTSGAVIFELSVLRRGLVPEWLVFGSVQKNHSNLGPRMFARKAAGLRALLQYFRQIRKYKERCADLQ